MFPLALGDDQDVHRAARMDPLLGTGRTGRSPGPDAEHGADPSRSSIRLPAGDAGRGGESGS